MTKIVNMHEAKSTLSRLVDEASAGEEIIIAKAGEPVAKLVPIDPPKPEAGGRPWGLWKGKVWMADDFDAPLPDDMIDAMEGKGEEW
jgi:prevent-host-death family protein